MYKMFSFPWEILFPQELCVRTVAQICAIYTVRHRTVTATVFTAFLQPVRITGYDYQEELFRSRLFTRLLVDYTTARNENDYNCHSGYGVTFVIALQQLSDDLLVI